MEAEITDVLKTIETGGLPSNLCTMQQRIQLYSETFSVIMVDIFQIYAYQAHCMLAPCNIPLVSSSPILFAASRVNLLYACISYGKGMACRL